MIEICRSSQSQIMEVRAYTTFKPGRDTYLNMLITDRPLSEISLEEVFEYKNDNDARKSVVKILTTTEMPGAITYIVLIVSSP